MCDIYIYIHIYIHIYTYIHIYIYCIYHCVVISLSSSVVGHRRSNLSQLGSIQRVNGPHQSGPRYHVPAIYRNRKSPLYFDDLPNMYIYIHIYTLVYLIYLISRSIKYLIYLNILYNMYIINMLSVHSYIKLSDFREDVPSKSGPSNGCVVENCGFWKMFIPKKSLKNQHWTRNMMIIGIGEHVEDSMPV